MEIRTKGGYISPTTPKEKKVLKQDCEKKSIFLFKGQEIGFSTNTITGNQM